MYIYIYIIHQDFISPFGRSSVVIPSSRFIDVRGLSPAMAFAATGSTKFKYLHLALDQQQ